MDMLLLASQCDLFIAGNTDMLHFAVAAGVPTVALFTDADDPACRPEGRPRVRVVEVAAGEKVDIETLMEAVEAVTGGRSGSGSKVIPAPDPDPAPAADA